MGPEEEKVEGAEVAEEATDTVAAPAEEVAETAVEDADEDADEDEDEDEEEVI